jgi:Arc/MetJ-type ribon-helix-helix transcriptional regulator
MGKTEKHSVTIDSELIKWAEKHMKTKRFSSLSHAVTYCMQKVKDEEEG